MIPTRAELWRELERCEQSYLPDTLNHARTAAANNLEFAVSRAISDNGISLVADLMAEIDFRGW